MDTRFKKNDSKRIPVTGDIVIVIMPPFAGLSLLFFFSRHSSNKEFVLKVEGSRLPSDSHGVVRFALL